MGTRTDRRMAQGRQRAWPAGLGVRGHLRLHLSRRPQGRGPLALSDAPPQTPSSAPIKAFARYHQGSRSIHQRPKNIDVGPKPAIGRATSSSASARGPCSFSMSASVTLAARLAGKTAAETISVMLAIFARIKPALRKSITFDNDTAFAQHGLLQSMRAMAAWFCDAYASWQKGGVENANGRLRRWLPRHIDIDRLSDAEIQDIVITANLTPRKCLGFKTPFQAILKELGKDAQIRFS